MAYRSYIPERREHAKRLLLPILMIVGISIAIGARSPQALELFLLKLLCVVGGFVLAHILRVVAFPYLNFATSTNPEHKWLVVGLYLACIWACACGG